MGPINVLKAQEYIKVLNNIFDDFNVAVNAEERDTLRTTLHALKKHIMKRWDVMMDADVDKVLSSIKERSCDTLWETLGEHGVTSVDPEEETPSGPKVLQTIPSQEPAVCEHLISLNVHTLLVLGNGTPITGLCPSSFTS